MRILEVLHFFMPRHTAGTEVYTDGIARELKRRGHDVHLFFTEKILSRRNYELVRREHEGIPCHVLINNLLYGSFRETFANEAVERAFAAVLDDLRPDVVHFQHLMLLSLRLPQLCAERGIKCLFTLHDFWLMCARFGQLLERGENVCRGPKPRKCAECIGDFKFAQTSLEKRVISAIRWTREVAGFDLAPVVDAWRGSSLARAGKLLRQAPAERAAPRPVAAPALEAVFKERAQALDAVLPHVARFLSPSKTLRERMVQFGMPAKKIKILPYGIHSISAKPRPEKAHGNGRGPVFGFIGTLSPHKGVHVAIEAMRHLKGHGELLIFGRGDYYPRYFARLKQLAEGAPIRFGGAVPRSRIGEAFAKIDALIMPSVWLENFPMVIQEAHAAKVPVIASNLGGMRESIRDGVDGLLFEAGDSKALAWTLAGLIKEPDRLAEMAQRAPQPMTLAEHVDQLERHLAEVAAR